MTQSPPRFGAGAFVFKVTALWSATRTVFIKFCIDIIVQINHNMSNQQLKQRR